jgi:hypothetical protein
MLHRNTHVRSPHSDSDLRLSVVMKEAGATLTLFFPLDTGWAGESELLELRLEPDNGTPFEPWRLVPRLPLYLQYARATLADRRDDMAAALRALRDAGATRRGLGDDFDSLVAQSYGALVAEGERHPVKALAEMQPVDISTASRWIKEARRRGLIPEKEADDA